MYWPMCRVTEFIRQNNQKGEKRKNFRMLSALLNVGREFLETGPPPNPTTVATAPKFDVLHTLIVVGNAFDNPVARVDHFPSVAIEPPPTFRLARTLLRLRGAQMSLSAAL
jgi:hypothetical protein